MSRPRLLSSLLFLWLAALVPLLGTGCARMVPQRVAEGVAALTVRQTGAVLQAIEADTTCGFSSPAVLAAVELSGGPGADGPGADAPGATGSATWVVEDCTLDFGDEPVAISTDCNGVSTWVRGAVDVRARKTVSGRLTGDPETPVIPETPDAVTFVIEEATLHDFGVSADGSTDAMRTVAGTFSATVAPQMAAGAETGACSEVTPHVAFEIDWAPATVVITSGSRTFDVTVQGGHLEATNGRVGEHENRVVGALTIWNGARTIALEGARGLDPAYDPATFEASYTCSDTLAKPVHSRCDLEPVLAENTARLIIKTFGMLVKTTDLDTGCGFGNLDTQAEELLTLDSLGALIFDTSRTLTFPTSSCPLGGDRFPIYEDCVGTGYFLDGTATLTGTQTVTGEVVISWPPLQPQVPDQAVVRFTHIGLDEVSVLEERAMSLEPEPYLTLHDGALTGVYHSVTGESASEPGAYFIRTPVGEFEEIRLSDSDVTLHNGAMAFPMHVDDAELYALNGSFGGASNWLFGRITIDGTTWTLGETGRPLVLDPAFDQAAFDATYVCTEDLLETVPPE